MTTKIRIEAEAAYLFFIEAVANRSQKSLQETCAETTIEDFLMNLEVLYQRYCAGEFSIGRMAEIMGLSPFQLDYILSLLGFPMQN